MPRRKLADAIDQFLKDVEAYLVGDQVLGSNTRSEDPNARMATPDLVRDQLTLQKKTLAVGRPVAEGLEACGEDAVCSWALRFLHDVEHGFDGAAALAIRPYWPQAVVELQKAAMRLRRGARPPDAGDSEAAPRKRRPPLAPAGGTDKAGMTLGEFMKYECQTLPLYLLKSRCHTLQKMASLKRVTLPPTVNIYRRGGKKFYQPDLLRAAWPSFIKVYPGLPPLKASN